MFQSNQNLISQINLATQPAPHLLIDEPVQFNYSRMQLSLYNLGSVLGGDFEFITTMITKSEPLKESSNGWDELILKVFKIINVTQRKLRIKFVVFHFDP